MKSARRKDKVQEELPTSYVVLSDVHLGADLVEHVRPWSRDTWLRQQVPVDACLETLLRHHAVAENGPVCFVLAGDVVDFMGMSLPAPASSSLRSGLTSEEEAHGLGSAADHAVLKLRAVACRHERVFQALAEVLSRGHSLVVVRGNHDLEWYWAGVQRAFVDEVCAHARDEGARRTIRAAVSFRVWFFHVPGLLYVEHGHEFDPMCSQGDPLFPVCLHDARRIRLTTSHVLMRYVARPTPGLSTVGHERARFGHYCMLAASFGVVGGLRLTLRFIRAALRLVREVLVYRWHRARFDRSKSSRLQSFARKHKVARDALLTLKRLHVRPGAQSMRAVFRDLYLDRVALGLLLLGGVFFASVAAVFDDALSFAVLNAVGACLIAAGGSVRDIDPSQRMRSAARCIANTLGVRYVVMGHTHEPRFDALDGEACYVNLGFWGEDELPEDRKPGTALPPCTYFYLRPGESGYEGALRRWHPERGSLAWLPETPAAALEVKAGGLAAISGAVHAQHAQGRVCTSTSN